MEALPWVLTIAGGVIVGAIGGWFAHTFALERSAADRKIVDATERIDRCSAMVAARVAYAAMWHRGGRWQPLKDERLTLERKNPLDVPAIVLGGTQEWDGYVEAEQRLRHDETTPREERAKAIEEAGGAALRLLATLRAKVRE